MSTFNPRTSPHVVPVYSLTGDLLNYVGCPYQYRLFTRTGVRESHPAQRWYGQFLHRGMSLAFERWKHHAVEVHAYEWHSGSGNAEYQALIDHVVRTLRAEGLFRPGNLGEVAEKRLLRSIRLLGALVFPLVDRSEVRLSAVRDCSAPNVDLYQVTGVIDVLAVAKFRDKGENMLVDLIQARLENAGYASDSRGEIVVDYKGINRDPMQGDSYWAARNQLLTYAWLRNKEANADVVRAGVLCMVNELLPEDADPNSTPVGDVARSLVEQSVEVVPMSGDLIDAGTRFFDSTVEQIEEALTKEAHVGLPTAWPPSPDRRTCIACDARWHCPASHIGDGASSVRPLAPSAP